MQINITLPDGSVRQYQAPVTPLQVAADISPRLAEAAVAARINGKLKDVGTAITQNSELSLVTKRDEADYQQVLRHSASHLLAQAVKRLYPGVQLAIGPAIDNGFYYDFLFEKPLSADDLGQIEEEMHKIAKEKLDIRRFSLPREQALEREAKEGQPYKVELIRDLPEGEEISFYAQGDFADLCAGPHILNTEEIKNFKLLSVAGAYWRGSEKNQMLTRIYATAFLKGADLEAYLHMLEEAKKRDHRRLGRELDLFDILDEGPGFPFFYPKGMVLRNQLEAFWRLRHQAAGYTEIKTPIILNEELWHRSGHWDHYKDNMYFVTIDDADYAIKPMNCPGSMLAYKRKLHSYRDFPERTAELGLVHRHELSGALHGLMRVRCFTQDDAHIFMTPDQIVEEVREVIGLIDDFYKVFGFEYHVELSTRPENSMGSDEDWQRATESLRQAMEKRGMPYKVNEGDGAFYGPKLDFHLKDSIGRTWQCGTIQLDFQMPERFDLSYIGPDGEKHRPVMIHRVVFGSIERFIAILTEHFAGAFPLWLAPVQVRVIPITERQLDYAKGVEAALRQAGLRSELDERNEKMGFKIRDAQVQKIPYMLVVGDKEQAAGQVAVRERAQGDLGVMALDAFINRAKLEIDELKN